MQNEYHEREEKPVGADKYATENPMDAVRNRRPGQAKPEETRENFSRRKKTDVSGNEFREKIEEPKPAEEKPAAEPKKKQKVRKQANIFVQVLNGDILTRDFVVNNLPFIFFLLFLLLLMVSKGYYGKQLTKDIDNLDTDVRAKTAEYIETKAKLEEATARYKLVEKLEPRGLKETVNPAKVIRLKKNDK